MNLYLNVDILFISFICHLLLTICETNWLHFLSEVSYFSKFKKNMGTDFFSLDTEMWNKIVISLNHSTIPFQTVEIITENNNLYEFI